MEYGSVKTETYITCKSQLHIWITLSGVCLSARPSICPSVYLLVVTVNLLVVTHFLVVARYVSQVTHGLLGVRSFCYFTEYVNVDDININLFLTLYIVKVVKEKCSFILNWVIFRNSFSYLVSQHCKYSSLTMAIYFNKQNSHDNAEYSSCVVFVWLHYCCSEWEGW